MAAADSNPGDFLRARLEKKNNTNQTTWIQNQTYFQAVNF